MDKEKVRAQEYNRQRMAQAGTIITGISILTGLGSFIGAVDWIQASTFGLVLGTNLQVTSYLIHINEKVSS